MIRSIIDRVSDLLPYYSSVTPFDIDSMRLKPDIISILKSLETEITNKKLKCKHCAYREQNVNHCWYTVVTDKVNFIDRKNKQHCKHFVDIDILLEKLK